MKKQKLAAIAMALATMGMGAIPQTLPSNQVQSPKSQNHNEGVDKQLMPLRRGPVTPLNPSGLTGDDYSYIGTNLSPKEYGQMLQAAGKQKWNKSKRK